MFASVATAAKALKNFDPFRSKSAYVEKIVKRELSRWLNRKMVSEVELAAARVHSLDMSMLSCDGSLLECEISLARSADIQSADFFADLECQTRLHRVLKVEMDSISADAGSREPAGYLTLALLAYGLDLKQQDIVLLLEARGISITQPTISRRLGSLRDRLLLKLWQEFLPELHAVANWERVERAGIPIETHPAFQKQYRDARAEVKAFLKSYLGDFVRYETFRFARESYRAELEESDRARSKADKAHLLKQSLRGWLRQHLSGSPLEPPVVEEIERKLDALTFAWSQPTDP